MPDHPRVTQSIGFYALQVEEFGDSLVIGAEELGIYLWTHRSALDLHKPVSSKKFGLKSETEEAPDAQFSGSKEDGLQDGMTYPLAMKLFLNRDGANFGQVFPDHVERPAANHFSVVHRHNKFLDALKERDGLFR